MTRRRVGALILTIGAMAACSRPEAKKSPPPQPVHEKPAAPRPSLPLPTTDLQKPLDYPGLHNLVAFAPGLISGSAPEEKGFESLAAMGIRTIVSVDGARPDVAAAKALGLRYVHLPIAYSGMSSARGLELARAVRDLPGPIYIHCHHGKHRSAAAAASITVRLGQQSSQEAQSRMKVSGTSSGYPGLYACALTDPASEAQLLAADASFPETSPVGDEIELMLAADTAFENLELCRKSRWAAPSTHPDLAPAAEAGQIADLFRVLSARKREAKASAAYIAYSDQQQQAASKLEKALLQPNREAAALAAFDAQLLELKASCTSCHKDFRDR